MAGDNVVTLSDDNFQSEVLASDVPVLVDFWAEWCQPCKMLTPTIDELADQYAGKVKIGKLDTDANREVAEQYGINAIPTIMLFKNGEVAKRFVGLTSKKDFEAALKAVL